MKDRASFFIRYPRIGSGNSSLLLTDAARLAGVLAVRRRAARRRRRRQMISAAGKVIARRRIIIPRHRSITPAIRRAGRRIRVLGLAGCRRERAKDLAGLTANIAAKRTRMEAMIVILRDARVVGPASNRIPGHFAFHAKLAEAFKHGAGAHADIL